MANQVHLALFISRLIVPMAAKWTWFAIGYQCVFAYAVALMINQFGALFTGSVNVIGLIFALLVLAFIIYMLFFKKYTEATRLSDKAVK